MKPESRLFRRSPFRRKTLSACLMLAAFALSAAPLSAHYFVNRLSFEVLLYPSSRPNKVIALQPNQCLKGRWNEYYTIVYYANTSQDKEQGKKTSRYRNPRSYCQSIAGNKLQCTRHLTVRRKQAGGIWLAGSTVETGVVEEFSAEQCLGEVRKL